MKERLYWIERKAFLKERLYWRKALLKGPDGKVFFPIVCFVQVVCIAMHCLNCLHSLHYPHCLHCLILSCNWNLAKSVTFCWNCEILVKIVKFCQNCEIWSKLWYSVGILKLRRNSEVLKFGQKFNCEIWLKLWNLVQIMKFGPNYEILSKL